MITLRAGVGGAWILSCVYAVAWALDGANGWLRLLACVAVCGASLWAVMQWISDVETRAREERLLRVLRAAAQEGQQVISIDLLSGLLRDPQLRQALEYEAYRREVAWEDRRRDGDCSER